MHRALKVRMFWVRHGLSCANVLSRCDVNESASEELLDDLEDALHGVPGLFRNASLNRTYGVAGPTETSTRCTVEIEDSVELARLVLGKHGLRLRSYDLRSKYSTP